jgi:hypothetical protein
VLSSKAPTVLARQRHLSYGASGAMHAYDGDRVEKTEADHNGLCLRMIWEI